MPAEVYLSLSLAPLDSSLVRGSLRQYAAAHFYLQTENLSVLFG